MAVANWFVRMRGDQRVRFLAVGGINTCIGYLDYAGLYWCLHTVLNYLVIGVLAHMLSVTISFLMYRALVFVDGRRGWKAFARYNLSAMTNLLLGSLWMFIMVSLLGLRPLVAQGFVIVISIGTNYVLHKFFTFASTEPPYTGV